MKARTSGEVVERTRPKAGGPPLSGRTPAGQLVGETLWRLGVRQVFGVVGSGNFVPTAALIAAGARYVGARHEGAAVTMADSYTRVSGELAVCSVHQGPGLTNTITGLVDAVKSRTPLLVITGQTSAGSIRSNFYVDQAGLIERTGAAVEQVHRPETVVEDTIRAYRRAWVERRPVVLNLPLDIQAVDVAAPAGLATDGTGMSRVPAPTRVSVEGVANLLATAQRPLIIAGRGAVVSGARGSLLKLGQRVGALLATTAVANGFFGEDPWTLGIAGGFASDEAAELMREADVVIGFGCSFTTWTLRHGRLVNPDAVVVQVDVDPGALGLTERVDVGVLGDSDETARAILDELAARDDDGPAYPGWRTETVGARIHRYGRAQTVDPGSVHTDVIHPRVLSLELETMLPAERTIVVDGGHFLGWPVTCWSVPDPEGFVFTSAGFQSIGLGLAAAVGARIARPDRLTVLAAGDGGFLMSVSELETLVRLRLPVLVVVYNDAAYGAEVHHFSGSGAGLELVRFPSTDIAALARGAGAGGVTVRDVADLAPVAAWLEKPDGPMIVDAKIDPDVVGYWAEQDFQGH
ncbi:thiamine pyrophosphate-binding protein [Phytoactinopolyspora limicola]|uniref:thiamine pyrophosphate-binding protein n=1 Tax=Phytoactinopolyspora limicola TaxID=2715536 RepID=UPI00140BEE66|nr:thiamine pyrophosphate-binding protein [Phytoactinopolyspora limicola]